MPSHEVFMSRCLELAAKAMGCVSPNPMVGAVLVHNGRILAEGYHEQYGRAHAEVNCLKNVKAEDPELIKDATLYVSLEPCAHHGKTPPCADLIIEKGIRKVVVGSSDPNPLVAGRGISKLRNAGIDVTEHVLQKECDFLNRRFITFHTKHRPYIILKWAQSADGFFAPEGKKQHWLTNEKSKTLTHKWRTEEDAILVGTNTVLIDNPQLTARHWDGRNPVRIMIDRELKVPTDSNIFDDEAMTIVYNEIQEGLQFGTIYVKTGFYVSLPQHIAEDLYTRDIQSLIIEGGANTLTHFIEAGLWDEARIFTAPSQLGSGIKAPQVEGLTHETLNLEDDSLIIKLNSGR
jgi:diaminohydroxyphosphoribosylaminopyrimidine deaminase / 5-amino-6-(5-phosphoribosylamino)uracil reductase